MAPLVSIIVPVYNGGRCLERCIMSLLSQTLDDFEAIIVDDGSTDNTKEIINTYTGLDRRLRSIFAEHGGQGRARNIGLENARGKYIGFVDSDDYIRPEMFEKMVYAAEREGAQAVQCNINRVDEGKGLIKEKIIAMDDKTVDVGQDFKSFILRYAKKIKYTGHCCNKLFLHSFLEENSLRFCDNSEVFAEDLLFNLDAALHLGKIVFLNEGLYNYVFSPRSHSQSTPLDKADKFLKLFEKYLSRAAAKYPHCAGAVTQLAAGYIMVYSTQVLYEEGGKEKIKRLFSEGGYPLILKHALKAAPLHEKPKYAALLILPYFFRFKFMKLYCRLIS